MQDAFGNYVLRMNSIGHYYPREEGGDGGGGGGAVGVVDPEGVQTSEAGTTYYNTANATFWVKASGSGNAGWQQLI